MIRVIVNGAAGKMGQLAVAAIKATSDLSLAAETGRHDDLTQIITSTAADVVLDLTEAAAAFDNAKVIITAGAHPAIGTSGLSDSEINVLTTLCHQQNLGGIIAPNFSIGAVLMMQFAAEAAKHYESVEIVETHHHQKKDKPSGTAVKTRHIMNKPNAPIHSIRLPGFVAHQSVIFGAPGESLTIKHDCIDREAYMPGVLLCCREVVKLDRLVYGMEHILR